MADYTDAILLRPVSAAAYYDRGKAYHALGDKTKASADYRRATELDSIYEDAYYE